MTKTITEQCDEARILRTKLIPISDSWEACEEGSRAQRIAVDAYSLIESRGDVVGNWIQKAVNCIERYEALAPALLETIADALEADGRTVDTSNNGSISGFGSNWQIYAELGGLSYRYAKGGDWANQESGAIDSIADALEAVRCACVEA